MSPCDRCLENRWKFTRADGIVVATCQNCEREVSFASKRSKPRQRPKPTPQRPASVTFTITKEGQRCRKCSTPVVRQSHSNPPKDKHGGYYFEYWFKCPGCCTLYMVEDAKRFFAEPAVPASNFQVILDNSTLRDPNLLPWE